MRALFGCGVFFQSNSGLVSALPSKCIGYGKLKEGLTLRYFTGCIDAKLKWLVQQLPVASSGVMPAEWPKLGVARYISLK